MMHGAMNVKFSFLNWTSYCEGGWITRKETYGACIEQISGAELRTEYLLEKLSENALLEDFTIKLANNMKIGL